MPDVTVAAVQPLSTNGDPQENLRRAEALVRDAVAQGAEVVLCPELLATGYAFEESLWEAAEPADGRTVAFLRRMAAAHGIYVGASFLEATGEDFVNTFVLAGPGGAELGRVRKGHVPLSENYLFTAAPGPHVIETDLGRIGVGICAENFWGLLYRELCRERPHLILMPYSAPMPGLLTGMLRAVAPHHARAFGAPVVMANKAGSTRTRVPPLPGLRVRLGFPGLSTVCDGTGAVRGRLGPEAGLVVARVPLGVGEGARMPRRERLAWLLRGKWSNVVFAPVVAVTEWLGRRSYRTNPRRPAAARRIQDVGRAGDRAGRPAPVTPTERGAR